VEFSLLTRIQVFVALNLVARAATAQATNAPVRFDYHAPAGCPGAGDFLNRVQSRTERARLGAPGELARTFVVEVRQDERGASARLDFTDARGAPVVRAVRGETCDEVVNAIALVTALAIDAEPVESAAAAPAAPPAPAVAQARASGRARAEPERRALPAPEPHAAVASAGMETGLESWLGPSPALAVGAFAEIGAYAGASGRLTLLVATSSALVAPPPGVEGAFRRADFVAALARAEGCPVAAVMGWGFRVVPCVALGVGALRGAGVEGTVEPTRSDTMLWADLVPTLRLDWTLADSLVFFAQGELGVPLVRHTFYFEGPRQDVFVVPALGGGGALGMAWRFP
jgi:hypothetical protein